MFASVKDTVELIESGSVATSGRLVMPRGNVISREHSAFFERSESLAISEFTYTISGSVSVFSSFDTRLPEYYSSDTSEVGFIQANITILQFLYNIPEIDALSAFIGGQSNFVQSLIECRIGIEAEFGKVIPTLEVAVDYEVDNWVNALIRIPTDVSNDEGGERLISFVRNWLRRQPADFRRQVTISVV